MFRDPPFEDELKNLRSQAKRASQLWGCNANTDCRKRMQDVFFPKYDRRPGDEWSEMYYPTINNIPGLFSKACCADFYIEGNLKEPATPE